MTARHPIVEREKTIDGDVYRCAPLRGDDMLDVFVLALRVCAPVVGEEIAGAALSGQPVDRALVSGSLADVLRALDPADVQVLRRRLSGVTEVRVKATGEWHRLDAVFGEHFAGRLPAMLQWMLHAFSVSFPLFLQGLTPSDATESPPTQTASPSPSTSRTSSGGR